MRERAWFWIRRYGAAEIAGLATICLLALPLQTAGAGIAVVTVAAVVGENIGFYGAMLLQTRRELRTTSPTASSAAVARRAVALLMAEFGTAEGVDSFLIRPATVAASLLVFGNSPAALVIGKIAADGVFYAIAAGCFLVTRHLGWRRTSEAQRSAGTPSAHVGAGVGGPT